jgi:hypothetical protein
MSNLLSNLSVQQLKQAIKLREKMEVLQAKLDHVFGSSESTPAAKGKPGRKPKNKMSAAGRARIAAAQRARWAKVKGKSGTLAKKGKRTMSAAAKKAISLAAKLRWKKAKAAGKNRL